MVNGVAWLFWFGLPSHYIVVHACRMIQLIQPVSPWKTVEDLCPQTVFTPVLFGQTLAHIPIRRFFFSVRRSFAVEWGAHRI